MSYQDESQALDAEISAVIEAWHRRGACLGEAAFNDLALRLFAYQFRYNQPYARYCLAVGVTEPRSWEEIPAVPAGAFREATLTTGNPAASALIFETSGTTAGVSGRHFLETPALYDAALLAGFDRFVLPDGIRRRYLNLVPNPADRPHSSLGYMMARIAQKRGVAATGWYLSDTELRFEAFLMETRAAIAQAQPVCIAATSFALVHVLDAMNEQATRLPLPVGSCIVHTGGFKGRSRTVEPTELEARICDSFGVGADTIVAEYGMTELSSQYYRLGSRSEFEAPPWLRTRVVGPERLTLQNGVAGSLIHVDLANRSSCIAIQTEDLGMRAEGGLRLIGRARESALRGCSLDAERVTTRR
jgi:hypothetical protein